MWRLGELLRGLGVQYLHAGTSNDDSFHSIRTIADAVEGSLVFVNKPDEHTIRLLSDCRCSVALLQKEWAEQRRKDIDALSSSIFLVEKPRLAVAQIMNMLYPEESDCPRGIHPTAQIHPDAVIDPSVSVGAHCIIGRCRIGEHSTIYPFTIIKDNAEIGRNVLIREYCHIGGCGFGFVRHDDGRLVRIPHIGNVVIEDDVELFPYVNVDRGTLGETRIQRGTKIDHYSHIGHNCHVGEHCIITAGTVFSGGSRIGNRSWVGVGTIIKEKVSVGDDVVIGLGAVVIGDVENNAVVAGVPARQLRKEE